MLPVRANVALLLAGLHLSGGCLSVPLDSKASDKPCLEGFCVADPTSKDWRALEGRFGWRQINGDAGDENLPDVDGDLVVWQTIREPGGNPASAVVGFDLASRRIIPIAVDNQTHNTRPYVSGTRVVFGEEPGGEAFGSGLRHLVLWEAGSGQKRRLDVGLKGVPSSDGFDGSWVVFYNAGSPEASENGLWAFNVDDGRRVNVYSALPGGRLPKGDTVYVSESDVAAGVVYYTLLRNDTRLRGNASVVAFDLEENVTRELYFAESEDFTMDRMAASVGWVVWETFVHPVGRGRQEVYALNTSTREVRMISQPEDGLANFPAAGGDWATFAFWSLDTGEKGLAAVHLPSQQRFDLLRTTNQAGDFDVQESGTDGRRVVAQIYRKSTQVFETTGSDAYWRELPPVRPAE